MAGSGSGCVECLVSGRGRWRCGSRYFAGRRESFGETPITYPIDEAQLPLNYSHKPTGRSDDYLNLTGEPLFPFGYGLSYCDFAYRDLKVQPAGKHTYRVSFSVQNQG